MYIVMIINDSTKYNEVRKKTKKEKGKKNTKKQKNHEPRKLDIQAWDIYSRICSADFRSSEIQIFNLD